MATCAVALHDKRLLAQRVGRRLVTLHGKRPSYSPTLVTAAMRRGDFPVARDCRGLNLFRSADDFASYHSAIGEVSDFAGMNADMPSAIGAHVDPGSASDLLGFEWLDAGCADDASGNVELS